MNKLHSMCVDTYTSSSKCCRCHAVQETGESWDQEEFAKHDKKKPASVMVEYPAGSNVWYNGVPQKWSVKEVLFRIGGRESKT